MASATARSWGTLRWATAKLSDDVELIKSLHLDSYRFSIEWARVEPERNKIDEDALKHYGDFIDALRAAGIRPVVTLHHFSNPVWVDDPRDPDCKNGPTDANLCGFGHPQGGPLVVKELAEHAKLLAERFGDRVDDWGTVNEPVNYLLASYGVGAFPPGKKYLLLLDKLVPVFRDYLSAHAAMYAAIKAADTKDADGDGVSASVGMSLSVADWVPSRGGEISADPADVAGRDRLVYVFHYLLADSLLAGKFDKDLDGTWDEEQPSWKGTLDWLGLQYYFRGGVTSVNGLVPVLGVTPCFSGFDYGFVSRPSTPATACRPWVRGLRPGALQRAHGFPPRALPRVAARGDRGRNRHRGRRAPRGERGASPGTDRESPPRRRGCPRLLSLEPVRQLRVGRRVLPRFGLYKVDYGELRAGSHPGCRRIRADCLGTQGLLGASRHLRR
ncbi:MAG: family 1 glycosylhydrolase [Polyangiaceae bacterium]